LAIRNLGPSVAFAKQGSSRQHLRRKAQAAHGGYRVIPLSHRLPLMISGIDRSLEQPKKFSQSTPPSLRP
jgi:hypothetical protein